MRRSKLLSAGCFLLAGVAQAAQAAGIGQTFPSIDAWVMSYPGKPGVLAVPNVTVNYGDLAGNGRRDWAGAVLFDDIHVGAARQIAILTQNADGSYTLAAQGPVESTDGGSWHHALEDVSVSNGSVYASWSSSWHGCADRSSQQIKFYKNQWRVIGAEFRRSAGIDTGEGYEPGDSATLSRNLITGTVIIHVTPVEGKPKSITRKRAPEILLFNGEFTEDSGGADEVDEYAKC